MSPPLSTLFVHAGPADVRRKSASAHSTSVSFVNFSSPDSTSFTHALDAVDADFAWRDGSWVWRITTLGAVGIGKLVAVASSCYISSWVLCTEPPLPKPLPGATEFHASELHAPDWLKSTTPIDPAKPFEGETALHLPPSD